MSTKPLDIKDHHTWQSLFVYLTIFSLLFWSFAGCTRSGTPAEPDHAVHQTTTWIIRTSLAHDALAFFNTLIADPYYLVFYQEEYNLFKPKFTPEVQQALTRLSEAKEQYQVILGVELCTVFSMGNPETLDDLIRLAQHPDSLRQPLIQSGLSTAYQDDAMWTAIISVMPDVLTVLGFLKEFDFESYWTQEILPDSQALAERLHQELSAYNIIPAIEAETGLSLPSDQFEVYLVYFISPHAARLPGARIMQETRELSPDFYVRMAIHELLHQPYEVDNQDFWDAIDVLKQDAFLMERFESHESSVGYNDWESYVAESSVDALEQVVSEQFGVARPLSQRFGPDEDDGMHVLAPAIYVLIKQEGFPQGDESFQDFLIRMVQKGKLAPGKMETLLEEFNSMKEFKQ